MTYRTNPNVVCSEIFGKYLLVAARTEWAVLPYVQEINADAAYCWELIRTDGTLDEMVRKLSEQYRITSEDARIGILSFLEQLTQKGYVSVEDTIDG